MQEKHDEYYTPIQELDVYTRMFKIRGRVVQKSQIREWDKGTSKGKIFTAVLFDGHK